mmetsp:Transcript_60366/g.126328  ORF Transcript_60366/g.126328 Transcript_60366/m.126328 type:complete len:215 (-) Transcript_60366:209-853(-)
MSSTLGYIDDLLFELYTLHVRCIEKGIGMDPATMSRFVINLDALLVETQIDKVRVRISKMQELLQTHAARSVFPAQKHDVLVPPALDQMETASSREKESTEQLLLERQAREAAQRKCAEMETRLRDREAEMMEQIEEMQCEYEARLEDLGLSLAQGEAESPSESIRTQMEAVRCEEEEGPLSVGLQALIDSLQAAGAGATPSARDISVQALRTL